MTTFDKGLSGCVGEVQSNGYKDGQSSLSEDCCHTQLSV